MSLDAPDETTPSPTPPPPPRKKRRLRRWLIGLLLIIVLPLILGAGLVWYAVATESGTRFLLGEIAPHLPGKLTIGAQSGPLTGPLDLRDVHFRNDTLALRLGHLHLAWKAGKLRQRLLDIDQLHAEGIRVTQLKTGDNTA